LWEWVWVDPEHRRQGICSARLPLFVERYGNMLVDQPNPHAVALLEKTGFGFLRAREARVGRSANGLRVNCALHQAVGGSKQAACTTTSTSMVRAAGGR
jgi:ribosomal protein S18 acetylase RimI-like enzyme